MIEHDVSVWEAFELSIKTFLALIPQDIVDSRIDFKGSRIPQQIMRSMTSALKKALLK